MSLATGYTEGQLHRMIATGDLSLVVQIANQLLEDQAELRRHVESLRRENEGLEALVRGLEPPDWMSRSRMTFDHPSLLSPPQASAGAPGLAPSREPKGRSEASGLPADIQSAMRVIDALRSCAETLEDAADHLADVVDRQLKASDLP